MHRKIIVTDDNSKTLLIPELNETYHSTKGALTEALHIFIKEGLIYSGKKDLNIFEMGMGTGLNALLTLNHAIQSKIRINYTAIEKFMLDYKKISELDYIYDTDLKDIEHLFKQIHESPTNENTKIHQYFNLYKIEDDISNLNIPQESIDIIFYDAFGPKVQAELWTKEIMQDMQNILKKDGILITYCAQGAFKRILKGLNFDVQSIPGPPGKREITRAIKK